MLICADIGNSTTSFGCFEGDTLLFYTTIDSNPKPSPEQLEEVFSALLRYGHKTKADVEGVMVSSVVPEILDSLKKASLSFFAKEASVLSILSPMNIRVNVDHPEEVGADLLADSIAVRAEGKGDTLIVDLGTATKIILLTKDGAFEGCTIGVGPGIAKRALCLDTAALPEVDFTLPKKVLGKNTEDCINSALYYGLSEEAKGLCNLIEKEYGHPCNRVLTGGYGYLIKDLMEGFEFRPNLVLYGLKEAYDLQKGRR